MRKYSDTPPKSSATPNPWSAALVKISPLLDISVLVPTSCTPPIICDIVFKDLSTGFPITGKLPNELSVNAPIANLLIFRRQLSAAFPVLPSNHATIPSIPDCFITSSISDTILFLLVRPAYVDIHAPVFFMRNSVLLARSSLRASLSLRNP